MRTTLTLDDDLMLELKALAHQERKSFKAVVNAALRAGLLRLRSPARRRKPYRCPTFDMGLARVDLDRALELAGALEDEEILRKLELRK